MQRVAIQVRSLSHLTATPGRKVAVLSAPSVRSGVHACAWSTRGQAASLVPAQMRRTCLLASLNRLTAPLVGGPLPSSLIRCSLWVHKKTIDSARADPESHSRLMERIDARDILNHEAFGRTITVRRSGVAWGWIAAGLPRLGWWPRPSFSSLSPPCLLLLTTLFPFLPSLPPSPLPADSSTPCWSTFRRPWVRSSPSPNTTSPLRGRGGFARPRVRAGGS